jgi:hypothetical protein
LVGRRSSTKLRSMRSVDTQVDAVTRRQLEARKEGLEIVEEACRRGRVEPPKRSITPAVAASPAS